MRILEIWLWTLFFIACQFAHWPIGSGAYFCFIESDFKSFVAIINKHGPNKYGGSWRESWVVLAVPQ
jgi:hypothetical protein